MYARSPHSRGDYPGFCAEENWLMHSGTVTENGACDCVCFYALHQKKSSICGFK